MDSKKGERGLDAQVSTDIPILPGYENEVLESFGQNTGCTFHLKEMYTPKSVDKHTSLTSARGWGTAQQTLPGRGGDEAQTWCTFHLEELYTPKPPRLTTTQPLVDRTVDHSQGNAAVGAFQHTPEHPICCEHEGIIVAQLVREVYVGYCIRYAHPTEAKPNV